MWILTVDQGNSRAKLGLWELAEGGPRAAPRLRARARLESASAVDGDSEAWAPLRELGAAPDAVLMSSVASPSAAEHLAERLELAFGRAPAVNFDSGLAIECRNAHTIGRDRLFAARGAVELGVGDAIVLDCGTALTVDAVRAGEAEPNGEGELAKDGGPARFLGGAIAPGPRLLRDSLADGGARLWSVELDPRCPALGAETSEALASGVVHGLRGAAHELSRRVGLEAGCAGAVRLVTGGAAHFLLEPEPFWPGHLRHEPELVALGLLGAWREGPGGRG